MLLALLLPPLLVVIWFLRYRFKLVVKTDKLLQMGPFALSFYTNKMIYLQGEIVEITLFGQCNKMYLSKIVGPYKHNQIEQLSTVNSFSTAQLEAGYYFIYGANDTADFKAYFIVQRPIAKPKIVIVAPLTTWVAYNPYGGKSLYYNNIAPKNTHFVSTLRPNTALGDSENYRDNMHDISVEANIYNWFSQHYDVHIIADYQLETWAFDNQTKLLVLSYHCEYFSTLMYEKVKQFNNSTQKHLLWLGANQLYWKVKWSHNYTRLECRKDLSFFGFLNWGGMWRHQLVFEERLVGARFTNTGMSTYAPYKAVNTNHWLYKNCNIEEGELFGTRGINELPICGDETDKINLFSGSGIVLLAKGINKGNGLDFEIGLHESDEWNGDGGANFTLKTFNNNNMSLNTASIQSGSGLGIDTVFTQIIVNYVNRALHN